MDKDKLERIRNVRILTVLGMKDEGRKTFIRCPLHNEKGPSFCIYPDNSYYCFGCSKNGQNAIDLMMQMGATFPEAIQDLERFI